MGCVGAGSKRWFQVSVGSVNPDLSLSLVLSGCHATAALWTGFQRGAVWRTALIRLHHPAFSTPPANRGAKREVVRRDTQKETGRHRGRDWKSEARQEKEKSFFFKSEDFNCSQYTHTHTHIMVKLSLDLCPVTARLLSGAKISLQVSEWGPRGTPVILQWYFCSAPWIPGLSHTSAGPR